MTNPGGGGMTKHRRKPRSLRRGSCRSSCSASSSRRRCRRLARLGVADHMGDTPISADELAAKIGAHAPSLYRVMRMLAGVGVFTEEPGAKFALTPLGALLKTDGRDPCATRR